MLRLQLVEQHFCKLAHDCLVSTPYSVQISPPRMSQTDIKKFAELLQAYSRLVSQVECRPGVWKEVSPADQSSPMLHRQLRGHEALLTCIMVCLVHRHIVHDEWEGMSQYKLPLEADDLRHLVLQGNYVVKAACVVAQYVCKAAERVNGKRKGVCFSLAVSYTHLTLPTILLV